MNIKLSPLKIIGTFFQDEKNVFIIRIVGSHNNRIIVIEFCVVFFLFVPKKYYLNKLFRILFAVLTVI